MQGEKGLSTRLHAHTQPQWLRYSIMNGSLLEDAHGLHWQWALAAAAPASRPPPSRTQTNLELKLFLVDMNTS